MCQFVLSEVPDRRVVLGILVGGDSSVVDLDRLRPAGRFEDRLLLVAERAHDYQHVHVHRGVEGDVLVVAVTGGKMDFGPWEQIFYGEFDGRRKKRVLVKIIGE